MDILEHLLGLLEHIGMANVEQVKNAIAVNSDWVVGVLPFSKVSIVVFSFRLVDFGRLERNN